MYLDLTGDWTITLETQEGRQHGVIRLPDIAQAQGYGNVITKATPWVSSLHDENWWQREEYQYAQKQDCKVPFLAQPPRHFLGKAYYERTIELKEESKDTWYLYIELTHWKTTVYVDGVQTGEDCSLCTAHTLSCGKLSAGEHAITVEVDNRLQYPYRPDGHGVSDALGATWNGMAGELALMTADELEKRKKTRYIYALTHPRHIEIKDAKFFVDGSYEYFRGTHFGGEYPLTGYPVTDIDWWRRVFGIIRSWGLNFVRCHSYCPPEAAFAVADEAGVYLQPECGMWNHFEEGIPMLDILRQETKRILEQFGHHPSFVLFSPTNEPAGDWYQVLRRWVEETRAYDEQLGYAGRRVYTAQSGWFYDVEPAKVTGTDYLYFHRSGYGPYLGGTIRGNAGWKGGNYSPSLAGAAKPVICHELGQWCSYPDFSVIAKFTGYLRAGNYEVFRENCKAHGLLELNQAFAYASGRNQVRLYKEDIEANLRTPEIDGFELLDIHDYLGQGTALVGVLDAFWQEKGYVKPEEFRCFCGETVLLAAFPQYVYRVEQQIHIPVSVCHFGKEDIAACVIQWRLYAKEYGEWSSLIDSGAFAPLLLKQGGNTQAGTVLLNQQRLQEYVREHGNQQLLFELSIRNVTYNMWQFYLYEEQEEPAASRQPFYTQDWQMAKERLEKGDSVIYAPYLSDMSYECPPLSMRNTFWNGQLGPVWGRELGLIIDTDSRLWQDFPTETDGGWQWEDILRSARGFHLQGSLRELTPLVRVIDDWNRNLPLALMLEAKVQKGRLLLVSADLSGTYEERPAAYSLRQALLHYVASPDFAPKQEICAEDIEASLFPLLRTGTLVQGEERLTAASPATSVYSAGQYPIEIVLPFYKKVRLQGILYMPDQRERKRNDYPKEVELQLRRTSDGEWESIERTVFHNLSLSQKIIFSQTYEAVALRLLVHSCWGTPQDKEWQEYAEGFRYAPRRGEPTVKLGSIHLLCDEPSPHNNELFWEGQSTTKTKEIEA